MRDDGAAPPKTLADRLRHGDVFAPACPSRDVMRRMTSSWSVLALIALQDGTLRFSAIRRRINGVSERMLAQTLKGLEGDGLVERRSFPVVPRHVDYTLTALGREAAEKVASLAEWVERNVGLLTAGHDAASTADNDASLAAAGSRQAGRLTP